MTTLAIIVLQTVRSGATVPGMPVLGVDLLESARLAGLLAGLAVWMWAAPTALGRIRQGPRVRLPVWAGPRPGAPPARLRALGGALAATVVVLAVPLPGWAALACGVVVGAGVAVVAGRLESSAAQRIRVERIAAMPDALDLLAGVMEAGVPVRAAVDRATELGEDPCERDLASVSARMAAGVPETDAWAALAQVPGWQEVARDVSRAVGSGEAVARVLRAHAEELRREAAEQAEKKARKVGVSATMPLVCCHLPAFILLGVVPIIAGTVLRAL